MCVCVCIVNPQRLKCATSLSAMQETWFYQLSVASRRGRDESLELTPTEQHLATIFREGGALGEPGMRL